MGGQNTRTVTNNASPTANAWNQFLMNQLGSQRTAQPNSQFVAGAGYTQQGPYTGPRSEGPSFGDALEGTGFWNGNTMPGAISRGQYNQAANAPMAGNQQGQGFYQNPTGGLAQQIRGNGPASSGTPFLNLFNQMASGQVGDQSGAMNALRGFFGPQTQNAPQQSNPLLAGGGMSGNQQGAGFSNIGGPIGSPTGQPIIESLNRAGGGEGGYGRNLLGGPIGAATGQFGGQQDYTNSTDPDRQQNNFAMTGGAGGQGGGANNALPTFANPYQNQQFAGFNPSQLATNFGQGQTGMADLSGFGNIGPTNVNTSQGMGAMGTSGFDQQLQQLFSQGQNMMNNGGFTGSVAAQNVSMNPGLDYKGAYDTLGQDPLMERNRMLAVAEQRARFGADGAGALGTGAQYAEGTLNAQLNAQDASNRRGQAMQLMGQDLADRQAQAGVGLQNAGNNLQGQIASMQGGLQNQAQMQNLYGNQLNAALQGRGQDFNNQSMNRGMDINQLGLGLNQAQGNQNAALTQQGQMMNSLLQNQNMGNNFGLNAFQANSGNQQLNNANGMNMANMQNQFNLSNAGNMAQFGQGTNQLNLQSALGGQNALLQAIQMGLGQNNVGNNNQQQLLQMLFGSMNQANQLGTPQAQVTSSPSSGSQWGGLAGSLGMSWLNNGGWGQLGNLFGGGNGGGGMTGGGNTVVYGGQ